MEKYESMTYRKWTKTNTQTLSKQQQMQLFEDE